MKITKSQLKEIIKEEVSRLQKKTILENRKKEINKELASIMNEDESANEGFLGFGSDICDGCILWVSGSKGSVRFRKKDKGIFKVEGISNGHPSFYVGEIWKTDSKKLKVGMDTGKFGTIKAIEDGDGKSYEKIKI